MAARIATVPVSASGAETVRLNPASTKKQLDEARELVKEIARFGN